eukprot:5116618-Prorocentrum_lima.AAC.1
MGVPGFAGAETIILGELHPCNGCLLPLLPGWHGWVLCHAVLLPPRAGSPIEEFAFPAWGS